jgi:hypothetical protein
MSKRESRFVKHNVTRDNDTVGGEIETSITLMVGGIAKKSAQGGARS